MKRILKRIKMKAILPAAAVLAAAAIGTTFAWQKWDLGVKNELRSHTTEVTIEENFNPDKPFDRKEVKFTNEGSSSVFLRVSYTEYWQKGDYILSNQVGDQAIAEKVNWAPEENWVEYDGWCYYKKVLKSGESTSEILTKVKINGDLLDAFPENFPEEYVDAEYHLYFKAEAVQCSDGNNTLNSDAVNADALRKLFGMEAEVISADKDGVKLEWRRSASGKSKTGEKGGEG